MMRTSCLFLLGVLLALGGEARTADKKPPQKKAAGTGPAGTYKFIALVPPSEIPLYLLKMAKKDGKWSVAALATNEEAAPKVTAIENATSTGDRFSFDMKVAFQTNTGVQPQTWNIEGKIPADQSKPLLGSGRRGPGQYFLLRLEPTQLKKLDSYVLGKESLAEQKNTYKACFTAQNLVRLAKANKATPEEITGWAEEAYTVAGRFGPRFQRSVAMNLAQSLNMQGIQPDLAVDYAQKMEKLTGPAEPVANQIRMLEFIITLLEKAKKNKEVKKYRAAIADLRSRTHEDDLKKALTFKPEEFKGRKGKSTRVVLVEAFTGAQCEACPSVVIALNGLGSTYKPADVVLLEYHLNFPGPDPLANPSDKARYKYYFDQLEGTPSVFFNGKLGAPGGGPVADAEDKYREYRDVIDPLLEKTSKVKLSASAERTGSKITIKAEASGLDKPGENLRLRLALVEGWVAYAGKNGQRFHLHVVRDMPGGAEGLALVKKINKETARVDLDKLRTKLNDYLDSYAKHRPFLDEQRPLGFKNLSVVAFVQNDRTREVLQALQVKVTGEEPKAKEKTDDDKDEDNDKKTDKDKKKDKKRKKKSQEE